MEFDIVAKQVVEKIEAEKNGQESARASTPLSVALKPLGDSALPVEDTEVTRVTEVDKRAARFVPTNARQKCKGQRTFSTTDLVYLSFYLIYSLSCLFTGCMCETSA